MVSKRTGGKNSPKTVKVSSKAKSVSKGSKKGLLLDERIQTAEGWKRSNMVRTSKEKK